MNFTLSFGEILTLLGVLGSVGVFVLESHKSRRETIEAAQLHEGRLVKIETTLGFIIGQLGIGQRANDKERQA